MCAQANAPIIIKRVKKSGGEVHHGGAWKVAYADFVTAMMAFFMLMWLLNATTEKQRKGIADYFSPTIPLSRISGGGDGIFGGDSVLIQDTLAQTGQGGLPMPEQAGSREAIAGGKPESVAEAAAETRALAEIAERLTARSGESMVSDLARRHIITELTDEGLVVQIFDTKDEPLFAVGTAEPTVTLVEIASMLAEVFRLVTNGLSIEGFVAAPPVVIARNQSWDLSWSRADAVRTLLERAEFDPARVRRVTGHADRNAAVRNPMAERNNRVEMILLKSKR